MQSNINIQSGNMIDKQHAINYSEGDDWRHLPSLHQRLIESAIEAATRAYAPYSKFKVGAALVNHEETIITGNNQENASYPMCNCAEQVALQKTYSDNRETKVKLFAVVALNGNAELIAAPCGACRQVLCETVNRSGTDFPIIMASQSGAYRIFHSVKDLLPFSFEGKDLTS